MRSAPITRQPQVTHNVIALLALALASACSKQQPQDAAPSRPLVTLDAAATTQHPAQPAQSPQVLTSSVAAGGVPTTYHASFAGDQLRSIEEIRRTGSASDERGAYEFQGARLLKYSGASLDGMGKIEIELSLRGAVIATNADSKQVTAEQISAIRERAQLLRSHALAQRYAHSHQMQ